MKRYFRMEFEGNFFILHDMKRSWFGFGDWKKATVFHCFLGTKEQMQEFIVINNGELV